MRQLLSLYSWRYPITLVYMLQSTEYQVGPYLRWYWRTNDFSRIMYRRTLHRTKAARLLLLALRLGMVAQVLVAVGLILLWSLGHLSGGLVFGLALIIASPVLWAHVLVVPLVLGRLLIVGPRQRRLIKASKQIFATFEGTKIAVAGSYGKTSIKELLLTVLSEGRDVKATPANKNVSISHAYFAQKITGQEDILIIEFGEAKPGDIVDFTETTQPSCAIITGIAAAHLDKYKTMHEAAKDIFSVANFVPADSIFVNAESPEAKPFTKPGFNQYSQKGVLGWKIEDIKVTIEGLSFTMHRKAKTLELHCKLLGRHQVGPLALVAALAVEFGLTHEQIKQGFAKIKPFEHRMEPYHLAGATIIDDSYNGNLEGIRAGTQLLKELPATRKIYVTPGLVDQGKDSAHIHQEMGKLIANATPDIVVLMQHSVTDDIERGLQDASFKGQVIVNDDPLDFYNNLQAFVAKGDIVMLQNDWPDSYQ